jgi:putative transposase
VIVAYVHSHKDRFGVEPICAVLCEHGIQIAPSTYYARRQQPVTAAELAEAYLVNALVTLHQDNWGAYGARKLWHAARRAGFDIGRDQVARLMKIAGISGMVRGRHRTVTTRQDRSAPRHPDLVHRGWNTPARVDELWVADFSYVWTLAGFVYVAFVVDVFSRRILGWRVSTCREATSVTDAFRHALATRRWEHVTWTSKGLIHHSDAGSQSVHLGGPDQGAQGRAGVRLDRDRGGCAGQRPVRVHHRTVQERSHPRPVLDHEGRGRAPRRRLGALVQHHPAALLNRAPAPN